jgi:hypothetical protein
MSLCDINVVLNQGGYYLRQLPLYFDEVPADVWVVLEVAAELSRRRSQLISDIVELLLVLLELGLKGRVKQLLTFAKIVQENRTKL